MRVCKYCGGDDCNEAAHGARAYCFRCDEYTDLTTVVDLREMGFQQEARNDAMGWD